MACLNHGRSDADYLAEVDTLNRELRAREAQRRRGVWKDVPYRGLAYFDFRHAPIFFGREAEVEALIQKLTATEQGRQFLVVMGASGAGKSSLVRAGLWPRLDEGTVPALKGSDKWLIHAMTPLQFGNPEISLRVSLQHAINEKDGFEHKQDLVAELDSTRHLGEFAERLLPPAGEARWLLILDQLEELFAPQRNQESAQFLEWLLEGTRRGASRNASRFQVVATLRADFYHYCLEPGFEPLKRAMSRDGGQFLLGAPGRLALERMVSGPLTELDLPQRWDLDPALPPEMAADAWQHPGGLALMAFALRELYEKCGARRKLDLATYRGSEFGGLGGAIARRANDTLGHFGDDKTRALQSVFTRLVSINQDDAPTRKRALRSAWNGDPLGSRFVDAFVRARLLVAGDEHDAVIEVAHEALLREWPLLAEWIDQRREGFRFADSIRAEAKAWMAGDPTRHKRRPLAPEVIDERRKKLADAGLLEDLLRDPAVASLLTPEVDWILQELEWPETTHQRRRDIGQRLAELGDPRQGVAVIDGVPDILWRDIPGGTVEIKEHGAFSVKPFRMAAYPVTIAQFGAFVDAADGYRQKRWWKGLQQQQPMQQWNDRLTNHPVTHASWYDAVAFCRWLSSRWGFEVRLPTEQEWQWAAQSANPRFAYPWGEEWRADASNTNESDIHRTTAVGIYPQGRSDQQVFDLAGNVWEWCLNEHSDPKRVTPRASEARVLRGGSWFNFRDLARADYRGNFNPGFRNSNFGFRVVCSSPIR